VELSHAIFEHVTAYPSGSWDEHEIPIHRPDLVRAPYQIAAVCKSWRALALGAPQLWTYIDIPPEQTRYIDRRTDLNLVRSSPMPLIVVATISGYNAKIATGVLDKVLVHARRWRRFRFHAERRVDVGPEWSAFGTAMPLVEEIVITTHSRRLMTSATVVLPASPRLQRFACSAFLATTPTPWAKLNYLVINLRRLSVQYQLWNTLAFAVSLRELHLFFDYLDGMHQPVAHPDGEIALPHLELLGIYGHSPVEISGWAQSWVCPKLHTIVASTYGCYALGTFFAHLAKHIRILHIRHEPGSRISYRDAEAVLQLTELQELHLHGDMLVYDKLWLRSSQQLPSVAFWQELRTAVEAGTSLQKMRFLTAHGNILLGGEELEHLQVLMRVLAENATARNDAFTADCSDIMSPS